jgi:ribonuclease D
MLERLKKTGRGGWLDEEMERLADPENYRNDPDKAWQRVRISSRKAEVLGRLKAIARWRELEAQGKNLPRGRIAKDETIADLASNPPKKQADLAKVRGLSGSWATNDIGGRLMDAIAAAEPMGAAELPPREERGPALGKEGALVADLLKLLLKIRARDINVAARLLARTDELEALAAGQRNNLPILEGWRYDQFGHDALDLVEGRLGFTVRNGKLKMTRTEEEA